ncbi:MAG: FUSC family protein [Actinomycetes bacterium]
MDGNESKMSFLSRVKLALEPGPEPPMYRAGIAAVIDLVVVYAIVRGAMVVTNYPEPDLVHAALPAVFGGMFGFLGSLSGTLVSGLRRAVVLSVFSLPMTLLAIAVRDTPIAAAIVLGLVALGTGFMSWYGEPLRLLGILLLYMYFVPYVFGAGIGVPIGYLVFSFGVMVVVTVVLRALVQLLPDRWNPVPTPKPNKAKTESDTKAEPVPGAEPATEPWSAAKAAPAAKPAGHGRFVLRPQPELTAFHRTTTRSVIGLALGAFALTMTKDHQDVWVLMTLVALIPPSKPLTINRMLQRLAGTALAMVFLTAIDALVPAGPIRMVFLIPGLIATLAFVSSGYMLSVVGISCVAVLAYAQVHMPLGEALLWRGFDTLVGAVIAIALAVLIPVGRRPKPVWATGDPVSTK